MIPVFDGHNDLLLRLHNAPQNRKQIWLEGEGQGHLDLPRMKAAGFAAGFFAIYIPSPPSETDFMTAMQNPPFHLPLPDPVPVDQALPVALSMARHFLWMERAAPDDFKICRSTADIRAAAQLGQIAGILHMEGAEAIDEALDNLYLFHALGLRSLGPVWSRPTIFGHGVPFAYPSSPDTGPGLTEAGTRLIHACNDLHIMIDLSHLNAAGFEDVARLSNAPLVASHSNAHAITPASRNLTDRQLAMIRETGGMVGLNFATSFLRYDGRQDPNMDWDPMLRHLDHLISHLGADHVGFGSDFDGATLPAPMGDVTGLPAFQTQLRAHGYDAAMMQKLCYDNWLALLDRTWTV
jgi:membrane dipeptidase